MDTRSVGTALGIVAGAHLLSLSVALAQHPSSPAASPQADVAKLPPIAGTWIYAKDPKGVVASEAMYEDSTITFGAGGAYAFKLGDLPVALKGSWKVTGTDGDTVRVHTEYGQGRRNDLTLTLRRDPRGKVVGMEVREGDGSSGARYYVPQPQ